MSEDRGPSYWDVSELVEHLRAKYGVSCVFTLFPPIRLSSDGRMSSWGCRVQVMRGETGHQACQERNEYFGRGGSWKTAPAALHAALRVVEQRLSDKEQAAAKQATF